MRKRSFTPFILAVATAAGAWVFVGAARDALGPLAWAQRHLRNPFAMTSRATPAGPAVLQQIQSLNRLETCRYSGQVIVRGDTRGVLPAWLAGDRLLFVGQGEVVAGVDLSRMGAQDVVVAGETVSVRLPAAEVLHTRLDNQQSHVYERRSGIFTGPDMNLESRVRVQAETQIRDAALESGVLGTAQTNARDAISRQLRLAGFREVRFL